MKTKNRATIYAVLAVALYAINVPLSKILLNYVEPTMMASFLYLGAGLGLFIYGLVEKMYNKGITDIDILSMETFIEDLPTVKAEINAYGGVREIINQARAINTVNFELDIGQLNNYFLLNHHKMIQN